MWSSWHACKWNMGFLKFEDRDFSCGRTQCGCKSLDLRLQLFCQLAKCNQVLWTLLKTAAVEELWRCRLELIILGHLWVAWLHGQCNSDFYRLLSMCQSEITLNLLFGGKLLINTFPDQIKSLIFHLALTGLLCSHARKMLLFEKAC